MTASVVDGPQGNNGWFLGPAAATLSSIDSFDFLGFVTGPRELYWRLDDGPVEANVTLNGLAANEALTGSATITGDGIHTLTAWGIDNGGNREDNKTVTIGIDTVPPTTSATFAPSGTGSTMSLHATDATSGIDTTLVSHNHGPPAPYIGPIHMAPGDAASFHSRDAAGHEDPIQEVGIPEPAFTTPVRNESIVRGPTGNFTLGPLLAPGEGSARVVGDVRFELAVRPVVLDVANATLEVSTTGGETIHRANMTPNGTDDEGRLLYETTWRPPWGLWQNLRVEGRAFTPEGASGATVFNLTTINHPRNVSVAMSDDGNITLYDDTDGDGEVGPRETILTAPRAQALTLRENGNASYTAYMDHDGNGELDDGEHLVTTPAVVIGPNGSTDVYHDADQNGTHEPDERLLEAPPPPASETVHPCETLTDAGGYRCERVPARWDIASDAVPVTLGDDTATQPIELGFPFHYYGGPSSSVRIGSNGLVCIVIFTGCAVTNNWPTPSQGGPNGFVACYWEDLDPTAGGTITYAYEGDAPSRTFVVEFADVPHKRVTASQLAPLGPPVSFRTILHEDGTVECQYADAPSDGDGYPTTIAIESRNGDTGSIWTMSEVHAAGYGVAFSSDRPR